MTCGEFLKTLQQNPEKELEFVRVYDSRTNGRIESHGFRTIQDLGKVSFVVKKSENKVTCIINSY